MQLTVLHAKLVKAARADKPLESVPYAFEKRIMAHIRSYPVVDQWALWSNALWRAAAPCAAIALLLGAWTLLLPDPVGLATEEFAQHFENTVLAGVSAEQSLE